MSMCDALKFWSWLDYTSCLKQGSRIIREQGSATLVWNWEWKWDII